MALGCGGGAGGQPLAVELIGVEPLPTLDSAGSPSGNFAVYLGGRRPDGRLAVPAAGRLNLRCAEGACPVLSQRELPGSRAGALAIVIDDSGSNAATPQTCIGCPTDPQARRKEAVEALAQRLLTRAPGWRVGLFDFGPNTNGGFQGTRLLAGYTSVASDLVSGAHQLEAYGGTYLYDAVVDVAPTVAGEAGALRPDGGVLVPGHLLLVSDGEDTSSKRSLPEAIAAAKKLGVVIDAVGYGQPGDGGTIVLADRAYRDLRRLAAETGGVVTIVASDQLPALFALLADAYVDGAAAVTARAPAGQTRVTGSVGLEGDPTRREFFYQEVP